VIDPAKTTTCPLRSTSARAFAASITCLSDAKVFLPASIERSVWEYFARKAEQKGVGLQDLLTDVLRRDIEINEVLK
jgi:hypothetical protein